MESPDVEAASMDEHIAEVLGGIGDRQPFVLYHPYDRVRVSTCICGVNRTVVRRREYSCVYLHKGR